MNAVPVNVFKKALRQKRHQLGLWVSLSSPYSAEIVARAGFDWLMLDTEHAPNDLRTILAQLQAVAPHPAHAVVRPSWNDQIEQKRLLDIGAQTLLIPFINNADEAAAAVAGVRYPPRGVRGVAGTSRASGFGQIKNYVQLCENELCVIVQIESKEGFENIEEIANVDGVDGVFIGPSDLSANMGFIGEPSHPAVQKAVHDGIARILACGKAPGILTLDEGSAHRYIEMGSLFTAVGMDVALLARGAESLAQRFSK